MLLVIGYWLLVIGYWLLVIGYWLLVIGYWLLVIGYWLLVIGGLAHENKLGGARSYASMLRLFKSDPIVMISSCLRAITMGAPV
jgi:hypothetical protein